MYKFGLNISRTFSLTVTRWSSTNLKAILAAKIPAQHEKIKKFVQKHGNTSVGQATIRNIYGGLRGVLGLTCETSYLDPEEGIKFRGYTIPECQKLLPKAEGGDQPLPEGIFWLLLTGDIPTKEQVQYVSQEWSERAVLPAYICKLITSMPKEVHPMSQFSAACTVLNTESEFRKAYTKGVHKKKLWEFAYEDAMNLLAKVTPIAALIYRNTFKNTDKVGTITSGDDWSYNFCKMLGYKDPAFIELMRMYLSIHCDHEGGNVSMFTSVVVGSALSDPFLAFAAGMNGLAGPLHGLANQEVLTWLRSLQKEVGDNPSEDQIKDFVNKTLKSGRVVPGYGHAVLRKTDPRYICQREFAEKYMADDPLFKIVSSVFKVVPPILQSLGKVKNPWPNVDAHSGVLLQRYGLVEMQYYTVLFGVSRCIGIMANYIWSRGIGLPIVRPKSITTDRMMKLVGADDGKKGSKEEGEYRCGTAKN